MFTFLGSEKPLGIIRLAGNWILLRALALCFAANSRQSSEKKSGLIYYFFRKTTTELPESIYPLSSVVLCVYSDQLIVPAFPVSVLTFRLNHLLPFHSFRYGSLCLKTVSLRAYRRVFVVSSASVASLSFVSVFLIDVMAPLWISWSDCVSALQALVGDQ